MAKDSNKSGAAASNDAPGSKPTSATDVTEGLAAAGNTAPAAEGDRVGLDPDSDLGKAAARDRDASGGAIRAEDNTDAGRRPDGEAEASGAGTDPSTVEMVSVRVTGPFILHDPYTLETIEGDELREVPRTSFTDAKLAGGQLTDKAK